MRGVNNFTCNCGNALVMRRKKELVGLLYSLQYISKSVNTGHEVMDSGPLSMDNPNKQKIIILDCNFTLCHVVVTRCAFILSSFI